MGVVSFVYISVNFLFMLISKTLRVSRVSWGDDALKVRCEKEARSTQQL